MAKIDKVAIGASLGGQKTLSEYFKNLPKHCQASFFVVQHLAPHAESNLSYFLSKSTNLRVVEAESGIAVEPATVYVAKPNYHLTVTNDTIFCNVGPRENRFRPSIDVMMRSLAFEYRNRLIGIIVSGLLNDGASGLAAVNRSGGIVLVQDPKEAIAPGMPEAAIAATEPAAILNTRELALKTAELIGTLSTKQPVVSRMDELEQEYSNQLLSEPGVDNELGRLTWQTCPECAGPLWEMKDPAVRRFRCPIGHTFSHEHLIRFQDQYIEDCLWKAYRTLREKIRMLKLTINDAYKSKRTASAKYSEDILGKLTLKSQALAHLLEIDAEADVSKKSPTVTKLVMQD